MKTFITGVTEVMSDTFDHMVDAYESLNYDGNCGVEGGGAPPDPLFYHVKIKFLRIKAETPKAYLFDVGTTDFWCPKSITKKLKVEPDGCGSVYAHHKTLIKLLRGETLMGTDHNSEIISMLDIANDFASDFPDGAWFAYMMETVENYEDAVNDKRATKLTFDAHEHVMRWIELRGE
ncbi:MAG: hypothetical protein Unbinned4162contig1001_25 [Prokaryotic dsDNA virus sp.]|mgnify:CR=1 FL=1|nr:MAG: hypothetical protein Unbinned4162contig1001_25 [Prokaryotic dsDNA virus sp.]|tara:strand:- start:10143 stop:10673 length:531 start_codon:yes stop_codon:yes gene_type:complete